MADFVIREWNLAPYPDDQAPRHIHHCSDEAFYVLDGQLEVLVNDVIWARYNSSVVPSG